MPRKSEDWDSRVEKMYRERPLWIRGLVWLLRSGWDRGYTSNDLFRYLGPAGKRFMRFVVEKRLYRLNSDDEDTRIFKELFSEYLYHILAMNGGGSGEYALNRILMPGAFAYEPLCDRIGGLKALQEIHEFDVDFIYGVHDWMDSSNALKLKEEGVLDCNVHVVEDCGHQLTLEKPKGLGEALGNVIGPRKVGREMCGVEGSEMNSAEAAEDEATKWMFSK